MIATCRTNEAFEDSLTENKSYPILELRNASILIEDDRGEPSWYGFNRFLLSRKPDSEGNAD